MILCQHPWASLIDLCCYVSSTHLMPGACVAPYTWSHLQFSSVPKTRGLIPHKGGGRGSKSRSVISLQQSVLNSGLLMGTPGNGGTCFSPAPVKKGSSIWGKLTAWCVSACCYMRPNIWGCKDIKQRSPEPTSSFPAFTQQFSDHCQISEENRTLFAGHINPRAFRLMVSKAFLSTCWKWINSARLVWYHQVSDRILWSQS